jgi:hypothetical protein
VPVLVLGGACAADALDCEAIAFLKEFVFALFCCLCALDITQFQLILLTEQS